MNMIGKHNDDITNGKLFCAFIALIIASEMDNKLGDLIQKKSWSKNSLIRELNKMWVTTEASGKRLMNPMTETQRVILNRFGLGEDDFKSYVANK
jgi:hypothetical protein